MCVCVKIISLNIIKDTRKMPANTLFGAKSAKNIQYTRSNNIITMTGFCAKACFYAVYIWQISPTRLQTFIYIHTLPGLKSVRKSFFFIISFSSYVYTFAKTYEIVLCMNGWLYRRWWWWWYSYYIISYSLIQSHNVNIRMCSVAMWMLDVY